MSFSGHNIASETISDYVKTNKDASKRALIKKFPNDMEWDEKQPSDIKVALVE